MSKAGTPLLIKEQEDIFDQLPSQRFSGAMWTEPINALMVSGKADVSDSYHTFDFEINHLLNYHARAMIASWYKIVQRLSQTTIVPVHLIPLSSLVQPSVQEQEIWIEMPPHSVRDVVMNVKRMGRRKPVDFFDEVTEE
jgi:hypothetical protein